MASLVPVYLPGKVSVESRLHFKSGVDLPLVDNLVLISVDCEVGLDLGTAHVEVLFLTHVVRCCSLLCTRLSTHQFDGDTRLYFCCNVQRAFYPLDA